MTAPISVAPISKVAVLGAGHVGSALARVAVAASYEVSVAASGDPERIALIAQIVIPDAEARWAADAVADADVVILAIPLHKFRMFDPGLLAGKLVIDTTNYWQPIDGTQEMFEDAGYGSSEIVQNRLTGSTVVKTFNHMGYHELKDQRQPLGSSERKTLGVAGDDQEAVAVAAAMVERIGYDTVRLDSLRAGLSFEPGGPVFGASLSKNEFEQSVRPLVAA